MTETQKRCGSLETASAFVSWQGFFCFAKGVSLIEHIGIIGLGRMGATLAMALATARLPLTAIASRDQARAKELAKTIRLAGFAEPLVATPENLAHHAGLIFITTPDDAIAKTCAALDWDAKKTAVHCSGAQTLAALAAAKEKGASVGSFHPLNSFAQSDCASLEAMGEKVRVLKSSFIGLSVSDPLCLKELSELATLVGAGHFLIADEHRELYHVAAVMASNFVNTLLATSTHLWAQLGYGESDALRFMAPLLGTVCQNIMRLGPVAALTGPIARGDIGTVEKHLVALATLPPENGTAALYRAMALATLPLAQAKGNIDPDCYYKLSNLLQTEE